MFEMEEALLISSSSIFSSLASPLFLSMAEWEKPKKHGLFCIHCMDSVIIDVVIEVHVVCPCFSCPW